MADIISFVQQIIYALIFTLLVVNYIFTSKSLCDIGKKLNLNKTGFAWVPFASSFVLANITGHIDDSKDSTKKLCKMLCATTVTAAVIMVFTLLVFFYSVVNIRHALFIKEVTIVFECFLIMMMLGFTIFMVLRYFCTMYCIYKVFKHIESDKAVKYLIVSIIVPFVKAFLLKKCSNKFCVGQANADGCEE